MISFAINFKIFLVQYVTLFLGNDEGPPQRGGDWGQNRGRGGNPGYGARPRQERKSFSEDLPNPAPGMTSNQVYVYRVWSAAILVLT